MREILFEGKRKKSGEWVEGLPQKTWGEWHIIDKDNENIAYPIDPDTLRPYIGQNDKNDQKIYEEDICIIRTASIDEDDGYFIVRFDMNTLRFVLIGDDLQVDFGMISGSDCEVVGNVFETLELVADKE